MPDDKRLPYDDDIRVPLIVHRPVPFAQRGAGPGPSGWLLAGHGSCEECVSCNGLVLNIDLAPTLLDIAGAVPLPGTDGRSYLWMLQPNRTSSSPHPATSTAAEEPAPPRHDFLVEYHGEFGGGSDGQYSPLKPPLFKTPPFFVLPKGVVSASKMQDCENNTYSCLRTVRTVAPWQGSRSPNANNTSDNTSNSSSSSSSNNNTLFCRFYSTDAAWEANTPYTTEYYDLSLDPFQMDNTAAGLSTERAALLNARLDSLRGCTGQSCQAQGSVHETDAAS